MYIKQTIENLKKIIRKSSQKKFFRKQTDQMLNVLSHPDIDPERLKETKRFIKAIDCKKMRNTKI